MEFDKGIVIISNLYSFYSLIYIHLFHLAIRSRKDNIGVQRRIIEVGSDMRRDYEGEESKLQIPNILRTRTLEIWETIGHGSSISDVDVEQLKADSP